MPEHGKSFGFGAAYRLASPNHGLKLAKPRWLEWTCFA